MAAHGQNLWHELMTTDVDAAKRFYSELIGWTTQAWGDAAAKTPYTMWVVGERPIGGVMVLPPEAKTMGAPPHWLAYTMVDDADATSEKAAALGGRVYKAPFDIPEVGRIAILADPQGATFAIIQPVEESTAAAHDKTGEFGWAELHTTDYEAAWTYYSALFGWKRHGSIELPPGGDYLLFSDAAAVTRGGMSNAAAKTQSPAHWLHYVTVADLDATLDRLAKSGGTVINGPLTIPGGNRIAQCRDPQGALFALFTNVSAK